MGRFLGPEDYGVLESLISLNYFLGVPVGVLGLIIVRYVSSHKENKSEISDFVLTLIQKLSVWGLVVLALFLLCFPFLKNLLKVNSFILFLGVGLFSYIGIFSSFFSSVFQGLTEFLKLSLLGILNTWSKLIFAVIFVLLGAGVFGAIYAIVLSVIICIIIGYLVLRKYISFKVEKSISLSQSFKGIKNYSFSVFVSQLSMTSIYTVDIILAKFFLTPFEAGQYAALSILGKIVYFASSPITSAMFPLISERFAKKEKFVSTFLQSFFLVFLISTVIVGIYFLFPRLMINSLFGKEYLSSSVLLGYFAIFISFYSFSSIMINFFLSIAKTIVVTVPFAAALMQAELIFLFHSSIIEIVKVNIFSVVILFFSLIAIFLVKQKKWIFYQ